MVYRYRIWLKGINGTSALTHNQQQAVFKPGDGVWVKASHGRCTSKYKVGCVTGITSAQNITVNRMLRHVKDQVTILLQRSTQREQPPPKCFMCNHRIRGECSSNRNRRCALSAIDTQKPEEKDTRGVTCFIEENMISTHEVVRFNEHIRN